MEHWFHPVLQIHGHHRLGYPVLNSGHCQDSDTTTPDLGISTAFTGGGK